MHEFFYVYLKPKYNEKAKLFYMDTYSLIVHVKTEYIYKDIAEDVEKKFDPSNYELKRLLPKGKNEDVMGLMKDELSQKIMKEFPRLRAKTYSQLTDDNDESKKKKDTKKCVIKKPLNLKIIKNCLQACQLEN